MENGSRITEARRRLRSTRYAVGVAAGITFAGLALVARVAHPGASAHASSGGQSAAQTSATEADSGFFFDGGGSFGSSQSSTPQIRSGGS
jgi:hypothetical protein